MKDYDKKIELLNELIYKTESDYTKGMLERIRRDLQQNEKITRHEYFYLQDKEAEKAQEFYDKYVKGRDFGAIGGGMIYHFMPTGLGNVVKVSTMLEDNYEMTDDITDMESW